MLPQIYEGPYILPDDRPEIPTLPVDVRLDFWIDARCIWRLSRQLPTKPMLVAELAWNLEIPRWWRSGQSKDFVAPLVIVRSPGAYRKQLRRIARADAAYPISVMKINGRWVVLDGNREIIAVQLQQWHKPYIGGEGWGY